MKNLIVTSDWHLRDDKPRCRPKDEDWMKLQECSFGFLIKTAIENNADVVICGDIFHYDVVSNNLLHLFLSYVFKYSNVNVYILFGQHDMQYHQQGLYNTSCVILHEIAMYSKTSLKLVSEIGMGASFGLSNFTGIENGLYFTHRLVVPSKNIFYSMSAIAAQQLLDEYPKAKVIFSGDNHNHFIYKEKDSGRMVVAPGCLTRQSFAFNDYVPGFYLYDIDNHIISRIENTIDTADLVQDNYTEKKELKDESVSAFVESLRGVSQKKFTLSFLDNLKKAIEENTLENECVDFIQEMIREVRK